MAIEDAAERPVLLTDWRQRNRTFFAALEVERNVMFLILTLIVLVAALNIISGLIMLVKDKSSDIAILRTMGATRGAIMRVFLITGASIGIVGTIAGFSLGLLLALNVEAIRAFISRLTSTNLFPAELYFLSRLPAEVNPAEVFTVLGMAIVLSLLATLYPSWRAARLDPVEALAVRVSGMASGKQQPALFLSRVERRYPQGEARLDVLRGVDLAIWPGEIVALVAPSGTGKSTLLHVAGLLEKPDGGEVYVGGRPTASMDDAGRTRLRRHELGFVYQFHHLLPEFSALENVVMPQLIAGLAKSEARVRSEQLLAFLGLGERLAHRPGELSGGEQQRVAIARAVANAPRLLLADEPTGNLDPHTAAHVFQTLVAIVRASRLAALIATHNMDLAARMDRRVTIRDGLVVPLP